MTQNGDPGSDTTPGANPAEKLENASFSRLQAALLLIMILLLASGLFIMKHKQRLSAEPILLTEGDPSVYQFKVNVNTAGWEEIALLPGIGEGKAKAIVSWREKNGGFKEPGDLQAVDGIGPKTAAALDEYLAFEEASND